MKPQQTRDDYEALYKDQCPIINLACTIPTFGGCQDKKGGGYTPTFYLCGGWL